MTFEINFRDRNWNVRGGVYWVSRPSRIQVRAPFYFRPTLFPGDMPAGAMQGEDLLTSSVEAGRWNFWGARSSDAGAMRNFNFT